MNTTEKGTQYELLLYDLLRDRVDDHIDGKYTKLQLHKTYISKTCPSRSIDMDVSIDCYLCKEDMDNDEPYRSIIFECKNYKSKPDIGRYDEFSKKMGHLPGSKGYFVTTVGFSEETINSARAEGIGLILVKDSISGIKYIVKRTINDFNGYRNKLGSLYNGVYDGSSLAYDNGKFDTFEGILVDNKIPLKPEYCFKVPYYNPQFIEDAVSDLYKKYPYTNNIVSDILNNENIMIHQVKMSDNMLGYLNLTDSDIYLNDNLKPDDKRSRFTIAHELGHYFLHSNLLKKFISIVGETENSITDTVTNAEDVKYLEYQANSFAKNLLMPRIKFVNLVSDLFSRYSINRGRLFLDYQSVNKQNYRQITTLLSNEFNVSVSTVRIRLLELNLLEEGNMEDPFINMRRQNNFSPESRAFNF